MQRTLSIQLGLTVLLAGGLAQAQTTPISLWAWPAAPEAGTPDAGKWPFAQDVGKRLGLQLQYSIIPFGNDGVTKISAAAAGNNLPDIVQIPDRNLFFQMANQGLLAPVDSLLPLMPRRAKARYSDPVLNKLVTINGKVYGLQEKPLLVRRWGLLLRKDLLDQAGLKVPGTLAEFLTVAKALTKNGVSGYGARIDTTNGGSGLGNNFQWVYGAYGVAGAWNLSGRGPLANIKNPNYLKATLYIRDLIKAGVVDPDWPTLTTETYRSRWKQGKYAMFYDDFCASTCIANYGAFDAVNPKGVLVALPAPRGPGGKSAMNAFTANNGILLAVSKRAVDQGRGPAIAKLLEYMHSGPGYSLAAFGQKDVNYRLVGGVVTSAGVPANKAFNSKELQGETQLKNLVFTGSPSELKARYPDFKNSLGRTISPLAMYNALSKNRWVDLTPTSVIQPAPNQADIDRFISENLVAFVMDRKPLNEQTWADFLRQLDQVGFADYERGARDTLQKAGFLK